MAQLRIDVDPETYERLAAASVAERRPIRWQAEVILRRALAVPAEPASPTNEQSNDSGPLVDHEDQRVPA
jgi:hypothetical protein